MNLITDLLQFQQIDHLLRSGATGCPAAFARHLDIAECTLYRRLEEMRDQGFPIAYDKEKRTYYYSAPVELRILIAVNHETLLSIKGGEKSFNFFRPLSIFESAGYVSSGHFNAFI